MVKRVLLVQGLFGVSKRNQAKLSGASWIPDRSLEVLRGFSPLGVSELSLRRFLGENGRT